MSILFEALNKAAEAYRAQQAPVVIPLVQVPVQRKTTITRVVRVFIVILLVGFTAFFLTRPSFFSSRPPDRQVHSLAPMAPAKDKTAVSDVSDSSGIAIEARSLDPSVKQDEQIKSLETSLQAAPALLEVEGGEPDNQGAGRTGIVDVEEEEPLAGIQADPANQALQTGKWGKAIGLYSLRLKQAPQDRDAMAGLASALEHRGGDKDRDYLEALCEHYPDQAVFYAARGRLQAAQKDTKEAIFSLRSAVELDNDNSNTKLSLAILYDKTGQEAEALRAYQSLPKPLDPSVKARVDYLAERVLLRQAAHAPPPDHVEEEE